MTPETNLGKKVFFLYPHSVIRDELIKLIIRYEYEVYLIDVYKQLPALLARYPDSVVFINIDSRLSEEEWIEYVKNLLRNPATESVKVGIVSYEKNPALEKIYLLDLMVPCGFINLKLGLKESAKIILKTLQANEVKGRRRFVRAKCGTHCAATLNVKYHGKYYTGNIVDISSAGMAFSFDSQAIQYKNGEEVKDIQLRLKGAICKVSGRIAGSREQDGRLIYVLIFGKNIDQRDKSKIQEFIYNSLQNSINRELDEIRVPTRASKN